MRVLLLSSLVVSGIAFSSVLRADDSAPAKESTRENIREQVLKRFDKDGDGKLNEDEQSEAKKAMEARGGFGRPGGNFAEIVKKFDKDGDGKLNEEERTAARQEMAKLGGPGFAGGPAFNREEMIKRFDKDGDGQLSDDERTAAQEEMKKRFAQQGRPGAPGANVPTREQIVKRFDKDGNGQLDESEQAAAREAMREFQQARGGQAGRPDQAGADRLNRKQLLEKFDANGNGQLDPDERAKAMEEVRARRQKNREKKDEANDTDKPEA